MNSEENKKEILKSKKANKIFSNRHLGYMKYITTLTTLLMLVALYFLYCLLQRYGINV